MKPKRPAVDPELVKRLPDIVVYVEPRISFFRWLINGFKTTPTFYRDGYIREKEVPIPYIKQVEPVTEGVKNSLFSRFKKPKTLNTKASKGKKGKQSGSTLSKKEKDKVKILKTLLKELEKE